MAEQKEVLSQAEREAIDRQVEELAPRVLRFTAALIGDWSGAEDVTQEALVALVRATRRGRAPRDPLAFTITIARRRAIRWAVRRRAMEPIEKVAAVLRDPARDAHAKTAAAEQLAAASRKVAELPRGLRRALQLRIAGLSIAEIARLERVSESAVKMRVLRARRTLRAQLDTERHEHRICEAGEAKLQRAVGRKT